MFRQLRVVGGIDERRLSLHNTLCRRLRITPAGDVMREHRTAHNRQQ